MLQTRTGESWESGQIEGEGKHQPGLRRFAWGGGNGEFTVRLSWIEVWHVLGVRRLLRLRIFSDFFG